MKRLLLLGALLLCATGAWATVPDVPYFVTFSCSGSRGPYPFTFPVYDTSSISVYIDGTLINSTNYTSIPVNNNYTNGGSITLTVSYGPCNSPSTLEIIRATPKTQTVQFFDNMPIPMVTFGNSLDKLTEITQEVWGETVHSLQMQVGGVNFLSPASGGVITFNFVGCTVSGTQTGIAPTTVSTYLITCSGGGGGGGVSSVSGDGVLFDNSGSTGAVTLHQKTFLADNIYGNFTGSTGTPSTQAIPSCANDGSHFLTYPSHTLTCGSVTPSSGSFSTLTSGTNTTATMVVGTGASLAASGSGVLNANQISGHSVTAISGNTSTVGTTSGSLTNGHVLKADASGNIIDGGTAGSGTVTSVSSGSLPPLFSVSVSNPTSTPGISFAALNFAADNIYGNFTGSPAPAGVQAIPACANDGLHAISYPSHTLTCSSLNTAGGGVNTQTAPYTLQASDTGKLVLMNCGSACAVTMYGTPSAAFWGCIESIGSSTATVNLNSLNFNGSSSVPVLIKFQPMCFYSDGSNYFGDPPPVAGTNVTLTAASNGLTVAASSTTSLAFSGITSATNTTATMTCGTGCTVTTSGSGVNSANQITGGSTQTAVNYSLAGKAIVTTFANLTASTALYSPSAYSGTIPANFSGTTAGTSTVKCKTNPSGTITFTLKDETASATLGTVAVNSSCAATLATTGGTTQSLTAGNLLSMTPSGTDGSAIGIGITLYFTVTGP